MSSGFHEKTKIEFITYIYIMYEGCPKMLYNCIIALEFKANISLIHMHPVGNLFLDILLKLHKIS